MSLSTIGFSEGTGKSTLLRYGHCAVYSSQCMTGISPVTLFAVYVVTLMLTFRPMLGSSKLTGCVSNVSVCPLSTFTLTSSVLPCSPSSAATSVFRYVLVLTSSNNAFTLRDRSPFFENTWHSSKSYKV